MKYIFLEISNVTIFNTNIFIFDIFVFMDIIYNIEER